MLSRLPIALIVSVAAAATFAQTGEEPDCAIARRLARTPPGEAGSPVAVEVGLLVVDLAELDEATEELAVDFLFSLSWKDERLAASNLGGSLEDCVVHLGDVWHPELRFINRRSLQKELVDLADVDAEGNVNYRQRIYGRFSTPLQLRSLPFDRQVLPIRIAARYHPEDVQLAPAPFTGLYPRADLPGWTIESFDTHISTESVDGLGTFPVLESTFTVQRKLGFHVWRTFLPLAFITFMAWTVFWIDPQNLGPQIGVSTASTFTLLAFLLSARHTLPRIPYLTKADELILMATCLVFLALGEAILTGRLARMGKEALGMRIDWHARWIYPVLIVVLSVAIVAN
jgi:hypothetical protein